MKVFVLNHSGMDGDVITVHDSREAAEQASIAIMREHDERFDASPDWTPKLDEKLESALNANNFNVANQLSSTIWGNDFDVANRVWGSVLGESFNIHECELKGAFETGFRWGSSSCGTPPLTRYKFDSLAELNAFHLGVDEAIGWSDCRQVDPPFPEE